MTVTAHSERAIRFLRDAGVARSRDLERHGASRTQLRRLLELGAIERVGRGLYRLADLPPLSDPDLVTVATRVPRAVIALVSALHFHGLTTEIPHEVSIALPRGAARPKLDWPPLRVYRFSGEMFTSGIETADRDGVRIRAYSAVKTVADCFKFRNRIGVEVALGALRAGISERRFTPAQMIRAARLCRVDAVVRPYLEAVL